MVELLVIRHGETAWNAEKRLQGHLDIGLNALGLQQAAALGQALRDVRLDAIISSDLQRARQTAEAIAAHHRMAVTTDVGLRERCFGAFEGLLYGELESRHPSAYRSWMARELDSRYPSGINQAETLREFSARALAAIDRLATGSPRRIALVTHGGVLECAYRSATGTSLRLARDFDILNASVNRLRWTPDDMQILDWGNVSHLNLAGMPSLDEIAP